MQALLLCQTSQQDSTYIWGATWGNRTGEWVLRTLQKLFMTSEKCYLSSKKFTTTPFHRLGWGVGAGVDGELLRTHYSILFPLVAPPNTSDRYSCNHSISIITCRSSYFQQVSHRSYLWSQDLNHNLRWAMVLGRPLLPLEWVVMFE